MTTLTAATKPSRSTSRQTRGIVAAFIRRDLRNMRSYRYPFVLDTIFGSLQLVVYFFLSRAFEGLGSQDLNGAPTYFAFAAIGLVFALIIEAATTGIGERIRSGQLSGTLETLFAQPITVPQFCAGLVAFPFAFALVRALLYLVIAVIAMGLDLGQADWVGFIAIFLLTGLALASLGIFAGALAVLYKRGDTVSAVLLFGMTLISGAVVPVSAFPDWIATLGSVLPFRLSFDGARSALFTGSGWGTEAVGLMAFGALGLPVALYVFSRAVEAARRNGSLGQY